MNTDRLTAVTTHRGYSTENKRPVDLRIGDEFFRFENGKLTEYERYVPQLQEDLNQVDFKVRRNKQDEEKTK